MEHITKTCNSNNFLTYGFRDKANYQIIKTRKKLNLSRFDLKINISGKKDLLIKDFELNLLGDHNIANATAAIVVALNLGIKINIIKKALKKFTGIQRRFTKIFSLQKKEFFDDYAHHPTEIKALLKGVRDVNKNRKIISVFQPHRYSRVNMLEKEFSTCFGLSDEVVLCPIYSAGETKIKNYNQYNFSKLISKNSQVQVFNINSELDLLNFFKKNLFDNELVICMGAGSITNWIRNISKKI